MIFFIVNECKCYQKVLNKAETRQGLDLVLLCSIFKSKSKQ